LQRNTRAIALQRNRSTASAAARFRVVNQVKIAKIANFSALGW
jgi:hypothetical protein